MNLSYLTKKQSGVIFLLVYSLTLLMGLVVVFFGMRYGYNLIFTMLIADIMMTIVIFVIGLIIKNASLYDPYWSVIPFYVVIIWSFSFYGFTLPLNIILLIFVISFWSCRLTYNWWKNWNGFKQQDWRYDLLKNKNLKLYPITNLFGIHIIPTILVFLQLIIIFEILQYNTVNIFFIIGFIFSFIAPIIQFISDKQMFDFRHSIKKNKEVLKSGLWRFSRHPNYFGELLFWIGIYVMYFSYVRKIDTLILYPIFMILLFLFITIPMMEKKLIKRPEYKDYRNTVSMLIPFFPIKQSMKHSDKKEI